MSGDLRFNKTRLAPTPSGYLHLGNIYSFALTAAIARQSGAKILLRIDDFDRERTNRLYVQDIFDTLTFLGIPWDEGPRNPDEFEQAFSQTRRATSYSDALEQLRKQDILFACTCSRTDLLKLSPESIYQGTCRHKNIPLDTPNVSWRIRTNPSMMLRVRNVGGPTIAATLPDVMNDFIVRQRDGKAAYQLISVSDDLHFGVDLVARGADLWPSTLAQLYLASFLPQNSFASTAFFHHGLMKDETGNKLAKSAGATSVHYLREQGKSHAEIYATIAGMLGVNREVASWEDLVAGIDFFDADESQSPNSR